MDRSTVTEGLNALCAVARARMPDRIDNPHLQFAEIFWLTDAEVAEMHALKSLLPSAAQERASAIKRLLQRHPNLGEFR